MTFASRKKKKKRKLLKPGDWIVTAILLSLGVLSWIGIQKINTEVEPEKIRITTRDTVIEIELADTLLSLAGSVGETWISVEDNKVWVDEASCPRKICARQGKISKPGESLVCLPNQLVVEIIGSNQPDAVSY